MLRPFIFAREGRTINIDILVGDVLDVPTDVLISTANPWLQMTGGVNRYEIALFVDFAGPNQTICVMGRNVELDCDGPNVFYLETIDDSQCANYPTTVTITPG